MSVLLCLHGWGGSSESFQELRQALRDVDIEILSPDLPGFGEEPEPTRPWSIDDYAEWVETYLQNEQNTRPSMKEAPAILLLGHSHGGRIAIRLAKRKNIALQHLYLCAAAGIRHPRHLRRIIGLTLAKTGSFFLSLPGASMLRPFGKKWLYKLIRVHDYERASPIMRQTLINVSREDLTPELSMIDVPTDIFWGTDDRMTPYADAKIMEKNIPKSVLHTYPGVRHRIHRERAAEIAQVIAATIGS